jgi:Major Facilitator Superfamily.
MVDDRYLYCLSLSTPYVTSIRSMINCLCGCISSGFNLLRHYPQMAHQYSFFASSVEYLLQRHWQTLGRPFRWLRFVQNTKIPQSALISDVWEAEMRGKAMAIFTVAPFAGPALGPTVAGYIVVAGLSWRWLFWILAIFVNFFVFPMQPDWLTDPQISTQAAICWLLILFTMPETYEWVMLSLIWRIPIVNDWF